MIHGLILPLALLLGAAAHGGNEPAVQCGADLPSTAKQEVPPLTGRVMDDAELIRPSTEAALSRQLEQLEQNTRDQLVVVTLESLEGETIEAAGQRLGNGWGIGQDGLGNGVLLIIAPSERKVRIEVGCGLEGLLTDRRAASIIAATLLPLLREGQYEEAASAGVSEIIKVLESDIRRPAMKRQGAS